MNFIDHAISEIINGEVFVEAMADIYEYPEVRGELEKYPSWIKNIIAVIDYDTELGMDGLDLKSYADAVKVFDEIGLIEEAGVLRDYDNDISEENAEKCYERLAINNDYDVFWNKVYVYADENISDNKDRL
ncbi:hypothetical protein [uncultured Catenibacterium sp.]|uniref:hypothetical protein n=1 Tax=uncultured Catenibacterium sp. TaxID=286142 RepID=UPI0025E99631|nr:hypothetical protein [uncultured Catenibacterium sp.]